MGSATLIRRAGRATGVAPAEMFSFSSRSLAPDAESRLASVLFRSDSSEDAVRRCGFAAGASVDGARVNDEGTRLNVADDVASEERPFVDDPNDESGRLTATFSAEPLGRIDREGLRVPGSLLVLLASDIADEGRTTLGVAKIEDSRRIGAFAAGPGPTDVLLPILRFS